jgi:eukaryotic-like serine/threonine-protein kinase
VEEACEYVRQAALGLQHAHDRGFVHRDVKPGNILVAGERHLPQATEPVVVKLLDLGLSRAIDPDDVVVPDLTRDHTVVGTPDYMAPEQARSSKQVDHRADLYSLGCTFYFLLTGRPPFPDGNKLEKLMDHQGKPPPPIRHLRPDVPGAVAAILDRLLAKRPEDRVQSAAELAELLEPLARYPEGAAPVPVRWTPQEADPSDRTPETPIEITRPEESDSGGPSIVFENSLPGPVSRVGWPGATPRSVALTAPLAVLDEPPPPPLKPAIVLTVPVPKLRRRPRRPPPRRRGVHPALLVALAALAAAGLAVLLWQMTGQ